MFETAENGIYSRAHFIRRSHYSPFRLLKTRSLYSSLTLFAVLFKTKQYIILYYLNSTLLSDVKKYSRSLYSPFWAKNKCDHFIRRRIKWAPTVFGLAMRNGHVWCGLILLRTFFLRNVPKNVPRNVLTSPEHSKISKNHI